MFPWIKYFYYFSQVRDGKIKKLRLDREVDCNSKFSKRRDLTSNSTFDRSASRRRSGSTAIIIAMTGHKDLKLAAHYSKIDGEVQKDASLKILDHIQQLGFAEEAKLKQESLEVSEVNLGENVVHFRRAKGG